MPSISKLAEMPRFATTIYDDLLSEPSKSTCLLKMQVLHTRCLTHLF